MTTATRALPPHHRSLYCVKQFGCRRPECRARANAYTRNRYRRVGYGTWQPLVDAGPARAHIAALRETGASMPAIAAAARVSTATLARLVYGQPAGHPTERIRKESAAAIRAVRPQDCRVADGVIVDATGTRRRVQALVALGWSFTALSAQLGFHARPLGDIARADRVTSGTARKIRTGYARLVAYTPEQLGVRSQARTLARRVAEREGWYGPAAWDDIDDPACQPDTTPESELRTRELSRLRREEIAHLASFGIPEHEIAARLGMATAYVHDLIRDMRKEAA